MTEQHEWEHVWKLIVDWDESYYSRAVCGNDDCDETLTTEQVESHLNEYETLKKATETLSAERAGKMADEMETGRLISTSRHIRELRAYIAILEGKDE